MTRKPIAATEVAAQTGSNYPAPYDAPCRERARATLGDRFGLTDFGVNMLTLPPGAWSSQRHWHAREDEFVYVLEGTPTLVSDDGETELAPGMCAGFPAGQADGHHMVNRSDKPVVLLEVGSRRADDHVTYPDIDMQWSTPDGRFTRGNGDPV